MSYSQGSLGLSLPGNFLDRNTSRSTSSILSPSQLTKLKNKGAETRSFVQAVDAIQRMIKAGTVRPTVPDFCNQTDLQLLTLPKPGAKAFRRAPRNLQPDQLYISMMPAPKGVVLSPEQKEGVSDYFRARFDPIYAHYPVKVAHVCTWVGWADKCRHHQGAEGKPHTEPDHAMRNTKNGKAPSPLAPYSPREYAGKDPNNLAHHWISILSLLREWWKLPYGWMNVAGREVFYWCPVPNQHTKYGYRDVNGNEPFGKGDRRVEAEPISRYGTKVFMDALNSVGATTVPWDDAWYMTPDGPNPVTVPPLIYIMDQWPSNDSDAWSTYVFNRPKLESAVKWWRIAVATAKSKAQPEPDLFKAKGKLFQDYAHVQGGVVGLLSYALDQNKTLRAVTLFKRYVQDRIVEPVHRQLAKSKEEAGRLSSAVENGASSVAAAGQAPSLAEQAQAAIDATPDPVVQMGIVDGMIAQVTQLMGQIEAAPAAAQTLARVSPTYVKLSNFAGSVPLYYALNEAKQKGFENGKPQPVYRHLVCEASRRASEVTLEGASTYVSMSQRATKALEAWSSWAPQAQAAYNAYAEALQALQVIKGTINLPWYLKKLGPLPTWGWMAAGSGAFLGTAVVVRMRRKKPSIAKNRRRRTSRLRLPTSRR